jgi:hypothetical protein
MVSLEVRVCVLTDSVKQVPTIIFRGYDDVTPV